MSQKSGPEEQPAQDAISDVRRATRRHFSAEGKIRIVREGPRGEDSISEPRRRDGIASSMHYGRSNEFLEACVGARRDVGGDLIQVELHRVGVVEGERERRAHCRTRPLC